MAEKMIKKQENSTPEYRTNIERLYSVFMEKTDFLFYFSPDPDAVGSSIAMALFLHQFNKRCHLCLPDGFDLNLNFLFEIAKYNQIEILKDDEELYKCIETLNPVIITPDTPTHHLLPHFETIKELLTKIENYVTIEIDHHFGGDSEQIYSDSITLFTKANSCCEIIADTFQVFGTELNDQLGLEKLFPRNIVLCLLVGICFDTQFGKFLVNSETYNRWFSFFSERLRWLTWDNPDYITTSKQVFETINSMNAAKDKTMKRLMEYAIIKQHTGILILPYYRKYQSLSDTGDSTCIMSKLIGDLSNLVPETAGAVGILGFYDTIAQKYFLKIRRSHRFNQYDLRSLEDTIKNIFGDDFHGGGGHAGATSFRINNIERELFVNKANILFDQLAVIIGVFTISMKEKANALLTDKDISFDDDEDDEEYLKSLKKKSKRHKKDMFYLDLKKEKKPAKKAKKKKNKKKKK